MIEALSVRNYRSLLDITLPLAGLNVITGANGSGKSNLYRALRLLSHTATGDVVSALAAEGGLPSTFWAGPETFSRAMRSGEHPVQGGPRNKVKRLSMGFASDSLSYLVELGLPEPSSSAFRLDPEIKRECIWHGPVYRAASCLVDRKGPAVKVRDGRRWKVLDTRLPAFASMLAEVADFQSTPEIFKLREEIRQWRFYDHFRGDTEAPARQTQLATRTPIMHHDGRDLAAALQTIKEVGDRDKLNASIDAAFPGTRLHLQRVGEAGLAVELEQPGMLRRLSAPELSDGTLRFLLWVAALLTPRPPPMMVLNEPETSLHPDLLPALAGLIAHASSECQIWVVTHSNRLINALEEQTDCASLRLEKDLGETRLCGQGLLNTPAWQWAN